MLPFEMLVDRFVLDVHWYTGIQDISTFWEKKIDKSKHENRQIDKKYSLFQINSAILVEIAIGAFRWFPNSSSSDSIDSKLL
jgi:hypothetical protein